MKRIEPVRKDDELLEDIAAARRETDELHLWWLGQSGFLVHWDGCHLLFDPYLSDSLTRKYHGTDKPHVRLTEICVAPERLDFIQVATSSHNHTDHLDAETLKALRKVNPEMALIIPEANREFVEERLRGWTGGAPLGLNAGKTLRVGSFTFHGVPAAHNELETDEWGRHKYLGYVVEAGPWTIYHSGDTRRYEGMAELLRRWQIDVALLPINGHRPERRVAGNLEGDEAAVLAHDIGAKLVVPCHYDMFEFNTVSPDEFEQACRRLGQPFRTLRCGERWASSELE